MGKIIHCLLIDDDQDDQEIFLMCIVKLGLNIHCQTIDNAVDALRMLEEERDYIPDVIFIDVNMPKMNGVECLVKLKELEHLTQSRVFMYSTTAESRIVEESKKLGAEGFIVKPVRTSALTEKLDHVFKTNPKT